MNAATSSDDIGDKTPHVNFSLDGKSALVTGAARGIGQAICAALAAAAVTALGLTLIASVCRRRRDLALLKTLGFTRRQLAAAIAWQSTIAVTAGTIIGAMPRAKSTQIGSSGASDPCSTVQPPQRTACVRVSKFPIWIGCIRNLKAPPASTARRGSAP